MESVDHAGGWPCLGIRKEAPTDAAFTSTACPFCTRICTAHTSLLPGVVLDCVEVGFWAKPCCLGRDVYRGDSSSTLRRMCFLHPLGSKNWLQIHQPLKKEKQKKFMLALLVGWEAMRNLSHPSVTKYILCLVSLGGLLLTASNS